MRHAACREHALRWSLDTQNCRSSAAPLLVFDHGTQGGHTPSGNGGGDRDRGDPGHGNLGKGPQSDPEQPALAMRSRALSYEEACTGACPRSTAPVRCHMRRRARGRALGLNPVFRKTKRKTEGPQHFAFPEISRENIGCLVLHSGNSRVSLSLRAGLGQNLRQN